MTLAVTMDRRITSLLDRARPGWRAQLFTRRATYVGRNDVPVPWLSSNGTGMRWKTARATWSGANLDFEIDAEAFIIQSFLVRNILLLVVPSCVPQTLHYELAKDPCGVLGLDELFVQQTGGAEVSTMMNKTVIRFSALRHAVELG